MLWIILLGLRTKLVIDPTEPKQFHCLIILQLARLFLRHFICTDYSGKKRTIGLHYCIPTLTLKLHFQCHLQVQQCGKTQLVLVNCAFSVVCIIMLHTPLKEFQYLMAATLTHLAWFSHNLPLSLRSIISFSMNTYSMWQNSTYYSDNVSGVTKTQTVTPLTVEFHCQLFIVCIKLTVVQHTVFKSSIIKVSVACFKFHPKYSCYNYIHWPFVDVWHNCPHITFNHFGSLH